MNNAKPVRGEDTIFGRLYYQDADYSALEDECERLREKLAETKEQSETRWAGYVRESNLRREIEAELADAKSARDAYGQNALDMQAQRDALAAELAAIKGQDEHNEEQTDGHDN